MNGEHHNNRPGQQPGVNPTSRHNDRGMTLIEIIIVLGLMGIAALVVSVNLPEMHRRYVLEGETRQLTAFLRDVPNRAREINAPVFLTWDNAERRFVLSRDAGGSNVLDVFKIIDELAITGPAAPVLRCDLMGRAFVGTNTTMMTTRQSIALHHLFSTGSGAANFEILLSPLWTIEAGTV